MESGKRKAESGRPRLHPDTDAVRKLAAEHGITSAAAAALLRKQEVTPPPVAEAASDVLTRDDVDFETVPAPAD